MNDEINKSKTSTLAIVSFILGMLALLIGIITGLPAVLCGGIALYNIINSGKDGEKLKGQGIALAGIITGLIGIVYYFISKSGF